MSIVRVNAEKNPAYCPYCMRCRGLVRMKLIEPFHWGCQCGAEHDERDTAIVEGKSYLTEDNLHPDTVQTPARSAPRGEQRPCVHDPAPLARHGPYRGRNRRLRQGSSTASPELTL